MAMAVAAVAACGANPEPPATVAGAVPATSATAATATTVPATTTSTTLPATTTTVAPTTTVEPTTTTAAITDPRIFLLGDSVMAALVPSYTDQAGKVLGAIGWQVTLDAKESRFPDAGIAVLRARRDEIGQVVVIQLANNYGGDEARWAAQIDEIMAVLEGVPKVVFLTVSEFRQNRREVNDALRAALALHPAMVLADWNALTSADRSLTAGDRLHLTVRGARAYAQLIADTVGWAPGWAPPPADPPPADAPPATG